MKSAFSLKGKDTYIWHTYTAHFLRKWSQTASSVHQVENLRYSYFIKCFVFIAALLNMKYLYFFFPGVCFTSQEVSLFDTVDPLLFCYSLLRYKNFFIFNFLVFITQVDHNFSQLLYLTLIKTRCSTSASRGRTSHLWVCPMKSLSASDLSARRLHKYLESKYVLMRQGKSFTVFPIVYVN